MQTLAEFFQFLPQCCDADNYLRIGQTCAESGQCYDTLRPMGSVYWFSLPFRMGLSPSIGIISLHLVLASVSVLLSVLAMHNFFQLRQLSLRKQTGLCLVFLMASAISHAVFLNPTLQVPLSDTPASLFALIAIWLLFILPANNIAQLIAWISIGLCLGLAAWIRIFFLYAVIFVLLIWLVVWLRSQKRHVMELGVLFALLPIGIQLHATWQRTGEISYIDPQVTRQLLIEHRDNKSIGYDMVLDSRGVWNWFSDCPEYKPLLQSVQTFDLHSLNCLISGRINFYLGSYSPYNFVYLGGYNILWGENLLKNWREHKHNEQIWRTVNLKREEGIIVAPDNSRSADRLSKMDNSRPGEIYQTVALPSSTNPYVFSTWLWGNDSHNREVVYMVIRNHETQAIVARQEVPLSAKQEVKFMNAMITTSGLYDAAIELPASQQASSFYLWEELDLRLPEPNIENVEVSKIRLWSTWLLLANSTAFIIGTLVLGYGLKKRRDTGFRLAALLLVLICGQAILSLPEQRFAITPMIAAWVLCLSCITMLLANIIKKWRGR